VLLKSDLDVQQTNLGGYFRTLDFTIISRLLYQTCRSR
jgi:hypothetical protein